MNIHRLPRPIAALSAGALVAIVALAGFAAEGSSPTSKHQRTPVTVKVVMGFNPNVQFAPFYAAVQLGYYRKAGLNVNFNYATEPDALRLLAEGSIDFVDSGGDEVLAAAASGLPVKYVLTQYSRFPSALFFLQSSHIKKVQDLKGKTIGIPAKTGASYYGLLALLGANHVSASDVNIEPINYYQVSEVANHKVDAAMGYAPNEPVELRNLGKKVGEFDVYHWANIAGAGLATSDSLIAKNTPLVRRFVQATLKGLQFTIHHPKQAFTFCRKSISDLPDPSLQRRILNRAIAFWRPAVVPLGHMDPKVWQLTRSILLKYKVITVSGSATRYYTNRFVTG